MFCPWKGSHHKDSGAKVYALVLWFLKLTPQPDQDTKMFTFHQEVDMHGEHRCGVIGLSQIKSLCPMAPFIEGECPIYLSRETYIGDIFPKYHINHYASHAHFFQLQVA